MYGDNRFFSFHFPFPIPLNKHGTYAAGIFPLYIYHSAVALARSIIFSLARANWTRHISRHPLVLSGGGGGGLPKTSASSGVCDGWAPPPRARVCSDDTRYYTHTDTHDPHAYTRPTVHTQSHLDYVSIRI